MAVEQAKLENEVKRLGRKTTNPSSVAEKATTAKKADGPQLSAARKRTRRKPTQQVLRHNH
ncbi:hypothetical protein GCM10022384_33020 [Streptomyces marokkonensis]|uniref:Uncharacterized protein n=1 Tax=Streptomyces marokkonensis TaxID=324855 RepID=A0ABP7QEJ1_9ACTN